MVLDWLIALFLLPRTHPHIYTRGRHTHTHSELQDFMYRFEALPAVSKYLGSARCQTLPRYTPKAHHVQ